MTSNFSKSRSLLPIIVLCIGLGVLTSCTARKQSRLVLEANEIIEKGNYEEGSRLLRKAVSLDTSSQMAARALYKLGFVQEVYVRNNKSALLDYEEFLKVSQDPVANYEVQKRMAKLYFETDAPEKAATLYRNLINENKDSSEQDQFRYLLARAYFDQSLFRKSREAYQDLVERYPKSPYASQARFEVGNTYYMEGEYKIAIQALKQVLRKAPQSEHAVEAQFLIASCYDHLGRLRTAINLYESLKSRYLPRKVLEHRIADARKRLKKMAVKRRF